MKRIGTLAILATIAGGNLSYLASLDIPIFFKGYVLLIPIQMAALLYVAHRYQVWRRVM